ncbi:hypothetical protein [Loktanella sp. M215]|uniref:hypothetical protein n=1 Tax=Loktanella sp. M215 TaxID=2675431 RepID=UPI001F3E1E6E|nr:hypothetical protein [Loktanella sp. M215]MCF7701577.1 hypothetical protein [Loktanella sp. M215]
MKIVAWVGTFRVVQSTASVLRIDSNSDQLRTRGTTKQAACGTARCSISENRRLIGRYRQLSVKHTFYVAFVRVIYFFTKAILYVRIAKFGTPFRAF